MVIAAAKLIVPASTAPQRILYRLIALVFVFSVTILAKNPLSAVTHTLRNADLVITIDSEPVDYTEAFGPRFDRTAAVRQIVFHGIPLLGAWGLPDEFGIKGRGVLGYEEAAVGADFIKIGLGRLTKDKAIPYEYSARYQLSALYPVTKASTTDSLSLAQSSDNALPWRYHYDKTYRLIADHTLEITYALTNTGTTTWSFEHYNHHWFVLGASPVGPAYALETVLPLPERGADFVRTGRELRVGRNLSPKDYAYLAEDLTGAEAASNRFTLSAGGLCMVTYQGFFPPARFAAYVESRGFCPEIFFQAEVAPGQTIRWSAHYIFLLTENWSKQ